jgi:DNA-binding transcriptional ArsR family regulator
MSKVKFDFSTVRTRVIPILKRVEVEDYPAKIGRIYGWSRQHVCYYLGKLEKCGLVKRRVRSRAVFYELTGALRKLLNMEGATQPIPEQGSLDPYVI